jgi:hypothetical protein
MPYHLAENPPAYSAEQPRDNLPQISQILHNQQTQSFVRNTPCKRKRIRMQNSYMEACRANGKKLFCRSSAYIKRDAPETAYINMPVASSHY